LISSEQMPFMISHLIGHMLLLSVMKSLHVYGRSAFVLFILWSPSSCKASASMAEYLVITYTEISVDLIIHMRYDYMKINVVNFYRNLMYLHNMKGIIYSIKFMETFYFLANIFSWYSLIHALTDSLILSKFAFWAKWI